MSSITFRKNLEIQKNTKVMSITCMALLFACRRTNTEMLQNQKLLSSLNRGGLWTIIEDMQNYFYFCREVFYNSGRVKLIRKIPVDNIAFELKNVSYIKAFFNNMFQVLKSKLHPKFLIKLYLLYLLYFTNKTIYISTCPFICSRYCTEK